MEIIAHKPIGNGGLRTNCFQCGMLAGSRHGSIKTGIGNAEDAHITIIVADIFYQPVDGIIRITRFIGFISFLVFIKRTYIHKFPFTHPAAAYILANDDIIFPAIVTPVATPESCAEIFSIGRTGIRRAHHQDRVFFTLVLGLVYGGEQLNTIPHGNGHLNLRIVFHDPGGILVGLGKQAAAKDTEEAGKQ